MGWSTRKRDGLVEATEHQWKESVVSGPDCLGFRYLVVEVYFPQETGSLGNRGWALRVCKRAQCEGAVQQAASIK